MLHINHNYTHQKIHSYSAQNKYYKRFNRFQPLANFSLQASPVHLFKCFTAPCPRPIFLSVCNQFAFHYPLGDFIFGKCPARRRRWFFTNYTPSRSPYRCFNEQWFCILQISFTFTGPHIFLNTLISNTANISSDVYTRVYVSHPSVVTTVLIGAFYVPPLEFLRTSDDLRTVLRNLTLRKNQIVFFVSVSLVLFIMKINKE